MRPLDKTSLADTAANAIRAEILRRRWQVGEKLPNEATLCADLSVSRGTLREAVRVLASEGYLEARQGSGTYVLSVTDLGRPLSMARRASLRDQFEARLALEVEAARLAALRQTPAVIRKLRARLARRGHTDDGAAFVARDLAFHRAIVVASGNQALVELFDFFSSSIAETIGATLDGGLPEPDLDAHVAVVDAIAAGKPDAADAAVRRLTQDVIAALGRMIMS
ncbi:FadR/GntR family transcriptional regulator [Xanthobacteraceae bacterium A53D]